ncbi:hypothetical protein M918_18595 [Clostridium sp. BL8]|nr:hypothetical protein M918_18595 [Clostridium sp. BL8]
MVFVIFKLLLSQNISKFLDVVNESASAFIIESKKILDIDAT